MDTRYMTGSYVNEHGGGSSIVIGGLTQNNGHDIAGKQVQPLAKMVIMDAHMLVHLEDKVQDGIRR